MNFQWYSTTATPCDALKSPTPGRGPQGRHPHQNTGLGLGRERKKRGRLPCSRSTPGGQIRQNSFKIDKRSLSTLWLMRGVAPPHEDYHIIKREQYSILFSVADRANKGKVTLSDWTYFENLLEKPDAECCPPVVTTKWTSYGLRLSPGRGPMSRGNTCVLTARSVTIAMGAPVMVMMGGDASLNATMVVISGIIFPMGLGFGFGSWLERTIFSLRICLAGNCGQVPLSHFGPRWRARVGSILAPPARSLCSGEGRPPEIGHLVVLTTENLLEKPDAEYEIAFRLFDVERLGTVKYDDFGRLYELNKGPDSIQFDCRMSEPSKT
ncbi:mitochondrial aspartate-glutamate transporter agc1 [Neurospora sp. IMI 360204]|nr:mitochondrial aspartate-glutamate transporter agc1 [Neurospora sp. IMI 360204]